VVSLVLWIALMPAMIALSFASFALASETSGISLVPFFIALAIFVLKCVRINDKRPGREAFDDKKIVSPERWEELMEVIEKSAET
jgi:hypothetical protein